MNKTGGNRHAEDRPFVPLFLAIAAMNAGPFGRRRAGIAVLETRIEARFARPRRRG